MDPGILCFKHCGPKVFCFNPPKVCPICECDFDRNSTHFLPFRIPYPFIKATQYPCSVVIKPTIGDFLNDYYNYTDLHIGITTSNGTITEFDENGLRQKNNENEWTQCLLLEQIQSSWYDHWDNTLLTITNQKCWSASNYNEESYNCYTFVLNFLKQLNYNELSKAALNRTIFCEKYIVPKTVTAGKYISLYRKLKNTPFYIYRDL